MLDRDSKYFKFLRFLVQIKPTMKLEVEASRRRRNRHEGIFTHSMVLATVVYLTRLTFPAMQREDNKNLPKMIEVEFMLNRGNILSDCMQVLPDCTDAYHIQISKFYSDQSCRQACLDYTYEIRKSRFGDFPNFLDAMYIPTLVSYMTLLFLSRYYREDIHNFMHAEELYQICKKDDVLKIKKFFNKPENHNKVLRFYEYYHSVLRQALNKKWPNIQNYLMPMEHDRTLFQGFHQEKSKIFKLPLKVLQNISMFYSDYGWYPLSGPGCREIPYPIFHFEKFHETFREMVRDHYAQTRTLSSIEDSEEEEQDIGQSDISSLSLTRTERRATCWLFSCFQNKHGKSDDYQELVRMEEGNQFPSMTSVASSASVDSQAPLLSA